MKKIVIIGSGGAGKSTLARKLGNILNIEVIHLDRLFWKPNWEGVPKAEQQKIQHKLVTRDTWIIDGNYGGTMDIRLRAADTIIFLDMPRILCMYRVVKRFVTYRNKVRPDMGEGCKERLSWEFLKWLWQYPKTKRPIILEKLKKLEKDKNILILQSIKDVNAFLKSL